MDTAWCSVKGCQTEAKQGFKSYNFPTLDNFEKRSQWIIFCGHHFSWIPGKLSKICSAHFEEDDFALSKNGNRIMKLKDKAIPCVKDTSLINKDDPLDPNNTDEVDVEKMKEVDEMACRICLAETCVTDPISLFSQFEQETVAQMMTYCTSLEVEESDLLPKTICESCFSKLKSARELKQISIASNDYLRKVIENFYDFKSSVKQETNSADSLDIKLEPIEMLTIESYEIKDEEVAQPILKSSFKNLLKPNAKKKKVVWENKQIKTKVSLKKSRAVSKPVPKVGNPISDCLDCGKQFWQTDYFDNHRCHAEKTCSICNCKLESLSALLKHFKDTHPTDRQCSICQLDMKSARDLHFHIRTHKQANNSYMCEICGKNFYKNRFLKLHREAHTKQYTCDICGVILSCRSGMSIHMTGIHLKPEKYMCAKCPSEFGRKISWSMHQIRLHGAPAPVKCSICGLGFIYVSQLNIHTRESHLKIRQQDRMTNNYSDIYKCSICYRVFKHHPALHKHMKNHDKDHTITKAGLKLNKYACHLCDKKFYRRPMLEDHLRVHSGEKPYQCMKCMMCFGTSKTLRVHLIKIHKEVSPYVSSTPNYVPPTRVPVITHQ